MALVELVQRIAREPSPDDLWQLQPLLLAIGTPEAATARAVAGEFYAYLSQVRAKLTAKQYSSVAAQLAAGSVGMFAGQEIYEAFQSDREHALRHLVVGAVSEALEILSTVQHVKAWETDFALEHESAMWNLYAVWWRLSVDTQPELAPTDRAEHVNRLLNAVRDPQVNNAARLALIISLYQIALLVRLVPLALAEAQLMQAAGAE